MDDSLRLETDSKLSKRKYTGATLNGTNIHIKKVKIDQSYNGNNDNNFNRNDGKSFQKTDDYLWCKDYASSVLEVLFEREQRRTTFLNQSPQAEYRDYFVGLIMKLAEDEKMSRTAVHLGVYLLDVFMDNHKIALKRMGLVALVALFLGCKIEDCESNIPKINDLKTEFPLNDYPILERMMLQFFNWSILIPTAANFIEYYIEHVIDQQDYELVYNYERFSSFNSMKQYVGDLTLEYLNITLRYPNMLQNLPSKISAACIAAARRSSNIGLTWNSQLINLTQYTYDEIEEQVSNLIFYRTQLIKNNILNDTPESGYYTG